MQRKSSGMWGAGSQGSLTGYSFLRSSMSIGGPDEDYTNCELECTSVSGEYIGTAIAIEQVAFAKFSHVYKCFFTAGPAEGRLAAVKILTTGYSFSYDKARPLLDRLYNREVTVLTNLQHPNVIGLYGVGEIEKTGAKRKVIFLEWMHGGDARTLMDQAMRPMDPTAADSLILPLALALAAAHEAGFVHRDVKAGNVLLDSGVGNVRLADWGISVPLSEAGARMSTGGTVQRMPGSIGTEFWCAPEVERGLPHDDTSDVFSLAITYIELVTGRDPKYDNSEKGVLNINTPEAGFIPDTLPLGTQEWLARCLSPDSKGRPSMQELLESDVFQRIAARLAAEKDAEDTALAAAAAGEQEDESDLPTINAPLSEDQQHQAQSQLALMNPHSHQGQQGSYPGGGGGTEPSTCGTTTTTTGGTHSDTAAAAALLYGGGYHDRASTVTNASVSHTADAPTGPARTSSKGSGGGLFAAVREKLGRGGAAGNSSSAAGGSGDGRGRSDGGNGGGGAWQAAQQQQQQCPPSPSTTQQPPFFSSASLGSQLPSVTENSASASAAAAAGVRSSAAAGLPSMPGVAVGSPEWAASSTTSQQNVRHHSTASSGTAFGTAGTGTAAIQGGTGARSTPSSVTKPSPRPPPLLGRPVPLLIPNTQGSGTTGGGAASVTSTTGGYSVGSPALTPSNKGMALSPKGSPSGTMGGYSTTSGGHARRMPTKHGGARAGSLDGEDLIVGPASALAARAAAGAGGQGPDLRDAPFLVKPGEEEGLARSRGESAGNRSKSGAAGGGGGLSRRVSGGVETGLDDKGCRCTIC